MLESLLTVGYIFTSVFLRMTKSSKKMLFTEMEKRTFSLSNSSYKLVFRE